MGLKFRGSRVSWWLVAGFLYALLHVAIVVYAAVSPQPMLQQYALLDVKVYLKAAEAVANGQTPYEPEQWTTTLNYRYHPLYAMAYIPLRDASPTLLAVGFGVGLLLTYVAGLYLWWLASRRMNVTGLGTWMPLALFNSGFLAYLAFGNVHPALMLTSGIMLLALLDRRPALAGLMAALMALTKPQFLFILVLCVAFREWRLLLRTVLYTILFYLLCNAIYFVLAGPELGGYLLGDYFRFLLNASRTHPGYGFSPANDIAEQSLRFVFSRYFGKQDWIGPITTLIKGGVVIFFGAQILRLWRHNVGRDNRPEAAFVLLLLASSVVMLVNDEIHNMLIGGIVVAHAFTFRQLRLPSLLLLPWQFFEIGTFAAIAGLSWLDVQSNLPLVLFSIILAAYLNWRQIGILLRGAPQPDAPLSPALNLSTSQAGG
jgi:hypothetical protein